jgi:hypothetical protein
MNNRNPLLGTQCQKLGHMPPEVTHLPGGATRIRCPRCGKAVTEHGLADHPESAAA